MKSLILLMLISSIVSCGKITSCDGDFTYNICRIFYTESGNVEKIMLLEDDVDKLRDSIEENNSEEIADLKQRLLDLEIELNSIEVNSIDITRLEIQIEDLIIEIEVLKKKGHRHGKKKKKSKKGKKKHHNHRKP